MSKPFLIFTAVDVSLIDPAPAGKLGFDIDSTTGRPFVIDENGIVTFSLQTEEEIQDAVASALTDTATLELVYDDVANQIKGNVLDTPTVGGATPAQLRDRATHTGTQLSSTISDFVEAAQDAVGNALTDSSTVDFTYDDVGNTVTAAVLDSPLLGGQNSAYHLSRANHTGTQLASTVSDFTEAAQDAVAASFTATSTATLNYDDGLNQTSVTVLDAPTVGGFTPAQLRDRSTHTGTQLASTISDFNEAAQDAVGALLTDSATVDFTYNDAGNTLSAAVLDSPTVGGFTPAQLRDRSTHTGSQLSTTISDFVEAAQDAVGGALTDSATVDFTYNDAGNTITAAVLNSPLLGGQNSAFHLSRANHTGTQLSTTISDFNEAAQDAVGGILTDSATVDFTYDDVGNTVTAAVLNSPLLGGQSSAFHLSRANHTGTQTASTISDLAEAVQDLVGAALVDSATVDFTYNDPAGTVSAAVLDSPTVGGFTPAQLRDRATHTGTQTSSTISDFTEASQDAVAASFAATSTATLNYNDGLNQISVTVLDSPTVGGATPAQLRDRATHTGTQTSSTISDFVEAAQDAVGGILTDSSTVDFTYDDVGNTITAAVLDSPTVGGATPAQLRDRATHTGTQLSTTISDFNEAAQDAVGGILTDSATVDFTYNDAGNTITAAVLNSPLLGGQSSAFHLSRANHTGTQTASTISDLAEAVQDLVGAALVDSATVDFTYNDPAGTVSAAVLDSPTVSGFTPAQLRDRSTHTGTQTASTISDFNEAAQDAVGASLASSATATLNYNDAGNAITATVLDSPTVGGATPAQLRDRATHTGTQTSSTISDFTEAAQDAVGAALTDSATLDFTYNDVANTVTATVLDSPTVGGFTPAQLRDRSTHTGTQIASTISDFTEAAQDAVGASLTDSATVDFTYNDVANTISAVVLDSPTVGGATAAQLRDRATHTGTQLSTTISDFNEAAQDAVGGILTDSATVDFTYNDAGNTISATVLDSPTVGGATPAQLRDRATHTGTQLSTTISDFNEAAQDAVGASLTDTSTIDLTYNDGANTITADVINASITNAKLADVPTKTFKGRTAASTGVPTDLTQAEATAMINLATASLSGAMSPAQFKELSSLSYNAQADFGFVGDLVTTFDGTCSTGAPTKITSASALFVAGDVGKRITLAGAGVSNSMYVGTISAVDSATQVTVTPNVLTTQTNRGLQWGTDNTAAITAMVTAVNNSNYGAKVVFGASETNAYGFPARVAFNKPAQLEGFGGGYTSDSGDYTRAGGTRLAWWGTSSDGGVDFGGFIEFNPTGVQSLKRVALRHLWLDCRNGDQNQALYGLKLFSCHGFMVKDFAIIDALAVGLLTNVGTTPTEAKDTTRFSIRDACFRQLDNPAGAITTPFAMTSAVALTTTPQSLTVAANSLPISGYLWTVTTIGYPVLVKYTGGGGSTTLTGCTVSLPESVHTPTTVATGNIVQAVPGNGAAWVLDGGLGANTCCGVVQMVQVSHGTTWGPAALECKNSDSVDFFQLVVNGGDNVNAGAVNRITKPGVRLNGSATSVVLPARNNTFRSGDPGAGGVSSMALLNTGVRMAFPTGPNYWDLLQLGNGAPIPTVELGSSFDWNPNGGLRPGCKSSPSVTNQAIAAATLTAIGGTFLVLPPQAIRIGTVLTFTAILTTAAAGTAANTITIRLGVNGTTADPAIATFTTSNGTAAVSTAIIDVTLTVRTLGAAGTAVATCNIRNSAATGFINIGQAVLVGTMATFNTVTSGLLYVHMALQTGAAKTVTVTQSYSNCLNSGNPLNHLSWLNYETPAPFPKERNMLRLIHTQVAAGALLVNDIDDGLPNKTARRMVAPPDQYERDGYANATKQKCYVPRVNAANTAQAGYIDLTESDRVLLSAGKGVISGLVKANHLTVVSFVPANLNTPVLTLARLGVPGAGQITITGTTFLSVLPDVSSVVLTGTGAVTLTAAQITGGGGTFTATSIVIPAALVPGVALTTTSAQVRANGKSSAVVALTS